MYDCSTCEDRGEWRGRGCRKYHAEEFDPSAREWWMPRYGDGADSFVVEGVRANECPKSVVLAAPNSGELRAWIEIARRSEFAHQASGASLYGPDLSKWPARAVDALVTIQQEQNRAENARTAAEMERVKNG